MGPAGRPPRSSSSSKKTITIRVTEEEHALLTKAASPRYLSDWLRIKALDAPEVVALRPPSDEEPPNITDLRAALAMFDLKIRTAGETMPPEKQRAIEEMRQSVHALVGIAMQVAGLG